MDESNVINLNNVKFIESYRCPACEEMLPFHSLKGVVVVECSQCKSKVRISIRILTPEEVIQMDLSEN